MTSDLLFSPKCNFKSVYSLLRFVAVSFSSSNFPNCSSSRESSSVFADYLRSHFSVHCHWPKQSCLSHAKAPSSLWHGFSSSHFQAFLVFALLFFNLEDILHYSIYNMGKPLDSPASFRPVSFTSCVSKLFGRIILSRLLFFLESNSILSPRQAGFRPGRSTLDQLLFLAQPISDGFNKPRAGFRTILYTFDFSIHKSFVTLIYLLVSFESVELFRKDPFLGLYFSLSSEMISLLL